ncbi:hypothetical protein ACLB2K_012256 [Fragaria x ananassa]
MQAKRRIAVTRGLYQIPIAHVKDTSTTKKDSSELLHNTKIKETKINFSILSGFAFDPVPVAAEISKKLRVYMIFTHSTSRCI